MAHLPAALSFLYKTAASCHSVSLKKKKRKKKGALKRFLGVTLAVNQIIAEPLANSLQPFTVLNNKWIINFFIPALSFCSCSLCCFLYPRCVSRPTQRLELSPSHKPRCKLSLVDPTGKSLPTLRMLRWWAPIFPCKNLFSIVPWLSESDHIGKR